MATRHGGATSWVRWGHGSPGGDLGREGEWGRGEVGLVGGRTQLILKWIGDAMEVVAGDEKLFPFSYRR